MSTISTATGRDATREHSPWTSRRIRRSLRARDGSKPVVRAPIAIIISKTLIYSGVGSGVAITPVPSVVVAASSWVIVRACHLECYPTEVSNSRLDVQ